MHWIQRIQSKLFDNNNETNIFESGSHLVLYQIGMIGFDQIISFDTKNVTNTFEI